MSLFEPHALSPPKLDASRPNAQKPTCARTAPGTARSLMEGLRDGPRSGLYQDLAWNLMDGPPGTVGLAARAALLTPDKAPHGRLAEFVQVFRRPGMEVILALRRFQAEEGFKKIVFLYERSRHLHENKEWDVQNEAKTKLKTSCFLTKLTRRNPRVGWFLTKRTQRNLAQGRISLVHGLGTCGKIKAVAHARPLTGTRKPCKPCHSERSEESRSDLFVLASARTRARSFAALRMTAKGSG